MHDAGCALGLYCLYPSSYLSAHSHVQDKENQGSVSGTSAVRSKRPSLSHGIPTKISPSSWKTVVDSVLDNRDTLSSVFNFLVAGKPEHREQLGVLSGVCHKWTELANGEWYWKTISAALVPSDPQSNVVVCSRKRIADYGKCILGRGFMRDTGDFWGRISFTVDLLDGTDGTRLFWGEELSVGFHVDPGIVSFAVDLNGSRYIERKSISAAEKGFQSIFDYFNEAHPPDSPSRFRMRIFAVSAFLRAIVMFM